MSHFADTLRSLMTLENQTQEALAAGSGVDRTVISRLSRGLSLPDREQLAGLVAAISTDRARRLELLMAHLRDEAEAVHSRAGLDDRHYLIAPVGEAPDNTVTVPGELLEVVRLIVDEASQHDDMRAMLREFATMIVRHRAELADAAAGVYPFRQDTASRAVAESPLPPPQVHFATESPNPPMPADQALAAEQARRAHARRESKSAS